MNNLDQILTEMNLLENEILIFEPIAEHFHPLHWLESVGQYISQKTSEVEINVSKEGMKSVRLEVI